MGVTDVCQLGLTKSYQINQLFDAADGAREPHDRGAGRDARPVQARSAAQHRAASPASTSGSSDTLALVNLTERADVPVSELAYGEKRRLEIGLALATAPSLLLLDEPLAGMSPRERVETVALLKSIARGRTMIIIDHDMDALFELAEQITVLQEGRVLVEGTPDEIKSQRRGAGSLSRRRARSAMSLLEVNGLNSYYGDSPHPVRCLDLRVEKHEVVALLGRNGAGKIDDAQEPDGRGDAARRQVILDGAEPRRPAGRTASPGAACSSCPRSAASSAA